MTDRYAGLPPEDFQIEGYNRNPPGGQHAGVSGGVKITYLPLGWIAICDSDRSQHRNRAIALDMILGGLTGGGYK